MLTYAGATAAPASEPPPPTAAETGTSSTGGAPASEPTEPPLTAPSTHAAEGESKRCSVFDLEAHPDFSFRMGDVVLRLDPGILAFTCFTGADREVSFRIGDVVLRLDPGILLFTCFTGTKVQILTQITSPGVAADEVARQTCMYVCV